MRIKNFVFFGIACFSGGVLADSYRADIHALAYHSDYDNAGASETYGLLGGFYFSEVETANTPLAEAAFMGRNGAAYAEAYRTSWLGYDFESYKVGANYFLSEASLYFNVEAAQSKFESKEYGSDLNNDWNATLGVTPTDGLLVFTSYDRDDGYDANLAVKYVTALGADNFINIQASVADQEEGIYTLMGADYYFDHSLSIGGIFGNGDSDTTYQLRARKFFTEQFSAGLSYTNGDNSFSSVMLDAGFRF
ncbi:MAG TPA: putative porin [Cellvibrio sp.]|nr:putative porin [Cellvibrio sp.]